MKEFLQHLYSLLQQQNYQLWAACPQSPRKHCVCPPGGRKGNQGLLPAATACSRRWWLIILEKTEQESLQAQRVQHSPIQDIWHREPAQIRLLLQQMDCVDEGLQRSPGQERYMSVQCASIFRKCSDLKIWIPSNSERISVLDFLASFVALQGNDWTLKLSVSLWLIQVWTAEHILSL